MQILYIYINNANRELRSKILNFFELTVRKMLDIDFKLHFRLSKTTLEVWHLPMHFNIHIITYYK